MTVSKVTEERACVWCGQPTDGAPPCFCRRCALDRQRQVFGHTLAELAHDRRLYVEPRTPGGIFATATDGERRRALDTVRFTSKELSR